MKIIPIQPITKIKEYAKEEKEQARQEPQDKAQPKPQERTRPAIEGTGGSLLDEYC